MRLRPSHWIALALSLVLASCSAPVVKKATEPITGPWLFTLDIGGGNHLPFNVELTRDSTRWALTVLNSTERIAVDQVVIAGDSFHAQMPLFDSEFIGVFTSDSSLSGRWLNHLKGPDYSIPFHATAGRSERFLGVPNQEPRDLSGSWETHYSIGTADAYAAIGQFEQQGPRMRGTFLTETGDYRYLEGVVIGDSLLLSCFDGSHAFLFKAGWQSDSLIGRFWSGNHWQEPWVAVRNPAFTLRHPDSLTHLREGYAMADFRFPLIEGGYVSPLDSAHVGRVIMVQVMGSWCPNCVDETVLLDEMYAKYNHEGLSVVALAFEKQSDSLKAIEALRRFRDRLHVKYEIAYAGRAGKEEAAERLPFLDHVMSYPTCIFIDRAGRVRRIRTGFYGPGTGDHYLNYRRNLELFIERMLAEPAVVRKAA
ncbi:MAG: TlpA family protein disulfide reductase [Flavobacteriales bacterium]|nr:MAG: TlpA family protein disulfide reductase [Flavobacteriales bacterium]